MNEPIVRVSASLLLLHGLLVWRPSQWAVFDAQALIDNPLNRRPLIDAQTTHRGTIKTADGKVVAESSPGGHVCSASRKAGRRDHDSLQNRRGQAVTLPSLARSLE